MPTYEYVCVDCGSRLEVSQRFGDAALSVCEVCGGRLRKVFHPIGIVLKGSGFYRTEGRSEPKEAASETKKPKKSAGSSSEASGEKQEKSA
jgi:putative FmdB family regulatory protein